jgi:D-alanyl-D-alanine carboxypeptidase/D-alanyl-D-alanine-endopeptidase (penicillin-binding protein 4)
MGTSARWLRRFLPFGVLVSVAAGSWSAAGAIDHDEVSTRVEVYPVAPADPVLSARRVPRALQAPVADDALVPHLSALVASSPPDTCLVVSVDGRPAFSHNASTPLVPASNQKLLTSWAALQVLGPHTTFRTAVVTTSPRDGGRVDGDVWLVGGGDPVLMTDDWVAQFEGGDQIVRTRFEGLADALVAAGITEITGSVVGDESRYDSLRAVPTWADRLIDQSQAGPLSALLVNEGMARFPAEFVSRRHYEPAADPPTHAAGVLTRLLAERGVRVLGAPTAGTAPPDAAELAAIDSPPLRDLLRTVNAWSNNTAAELLVKELDRASAGSGTTAGGTAVISGTLASAGLPVGGVVVSDGSGLDEGGRLTCELVDALLRRAGVDSELASSLAVAGTSGTLRERFAGTVAEGRVRAKTGTLRSVTALSGFALSAVEDGTVLTFAYIANVSGSDGVVELWQVELQGPFVEALARYPDAPPISALVPRAPAPAT